MFAHFSRHHRAEQRLLAGEPRIDRRLSGARDLGDLIDAGTLKAAFEKHLFGGIEDRSSTSPARARGGRPDRTMALSLERLFVIVSCIHGGLFSR